MRVSSLEVLILITIFFLGLAIFQGCASTPVPVVAASPSSSQCTDECSTKLTLQMDTVKKFERLCIAFSYLHARFPADAKIAKNTQEGIAICKYIYGMK